MIFQTLDDKSQCVGIYAQGELFFDEIPQPLTKTWSYSGSLKEDANTEYARLYLQGNGIEEVCPPQLKDEFDRVSRKMHAYKKSFELGKVDLREHCFFDLVPHGALVEFCEVKNQITQHVFENYERPPNYDHLCAATKLLHKIKYQQLRIDASDCRRLFINSGLRSQAQKLIKMPAYIDYNLFGTVTGRLTTRPRSFPILTMKRELRALVKPQNDWFVSLDYNGAEVRTLLALSGQTQPQEDIHQWNLHNVFERPEMDREEAKTIFFAWLYNPDSTQIQTTYYDRKKVLDKYYDGEYINTMFHRKIAVEEWKALNYLIQSTTADLVLERAGVIDEALKGTPSFVSHIVHDEIVIDFCDQDRKKLAEVKEIFSQNKLAKFMVNLKAGPNYYEMETLTL